MVRNKKLKSIQARQEKRGAYERKRRKKNLYMKHTSQDTTRFKRGVEKIKKDVTTAPEIKGLNEVKERVSWLDKIKNYGKKKT